MTSLENYSEFPALTLSVGLITSLFLMLNIRYIVEILTNECLLQMKLNGDFLIRYSNVIKNQFLVCEI